jgi:hypothetical protein
LKGRESLCLSVDVVSKLTRSVLIPVEFVMALVGATMGAMLTFILPSYIFLNVSGEDNSKAVAKVSNISLFFIQPSMS